MGLVFVGTEMVFRVLSFGDLICEMVGEMVGELVGATVDERVGNGRWFSLVGWCVYWRSTSNRDLRIRAADFK